MAATRKLKLRFRNSDDHAGAGLRNLDSARTVNCWPCDLHRTYCPTLGFSITEPGPGEWHYPHPLKEPLVVKNPQFDSVVLLEPNVSAYWLLLVGMNKTFKPEASLEDSIKPYPDSSKPFFPCFFASLGHCVC